MPSFDTSGPGSTNALSGMNQFLEFLHGKPTEGVYLMSDKTKLALKKAGDIVE